MKKTRFGIVGTGRISGGGVLPLAGKRKEVRRGA